MDIDHYKTFLSLGAGLILAATGNCLQYDVTVIKSDNQSVLFGRGLNSSGDVVGYMQSTSTGAKQAILYRNGQLIKLGTMNGYYAEGLAINDNGVVVGWANTSSGNQHAFSWKNGSFTDLGSFEGYSIARDINEKGQIVGESFDSTRYPRAYIYEDGSMKDLGTLGGRLARAFAINNKGQVVGYAENGSSYGGSPHAFLYSNGTMTDLGTNGQMESYANDINDNGDVVGYLESPGGYMLSFLYRQGVMTELPRFIGYTNYALSINDHGTVVGSSEKVNLGLRGYVYQDGTLYDLNECVLQNVDGWSITGAIDINNNGQILCSAEQSRGGYQTWLLTPRAVPEPLSALGLAIGCGLVAVRKRRKN